MNEFETGFEKPSLDNRQLFELYTARMRTRATELCVGYATRVEMKERPGRWRWVIQLEKGWYSVCEIEIEPKRHAPHRANVSVTRRSRLRRVLTMAAARLCLAAAIVILLIGRLVARIGFLLILLLVFFFSYMNCTFGVIRLLESFTGRNEVNPERSRELTKRLRTVPLPAPQDLSRRQ